jgi:cytochrome P450
MIVELIFIIALVGATITLCKELIASQALKFYKRQGIKCIYVPFSGINKYKTRAPTSPDQLEGLQSLLEENNSEKVIAINSGSSSAPYILPIDRKLIKEIFLREKDCISKTPFVDGATLGYFDHSGPKALYRRGLFKQFFRQENMEKISPKIQEIALRHIRALKTDYWKPGDDLSEWREVNFGKMQQALMADIVDLILLEVDKPLYFKGKRLSIAIVDYMGELRSAAGDLFNSLTFGLAYDWGLIPRVRQIMKDYDELEAICYSMYQDRLKQKDRVLGTNVMDFIVHENRGKPENEQWTSKDIIGNINLFQAAGAGTSLNMSTSVIVHMGEDKKMQEAFREAVFDSFADTGDFDVKKVLDYPRVEILLKEMFRMFGSSPFSTPRKFHKNCKIGGITFRKGDKLMIPYSIKSKMQAYFDEPKKFKADRFDEKEAKKIGDKIDYLPFAAGLRNCIGQWLAKLFKAVIIGGMVTEFEIDSANLKNNFLRLQVGYGVERSIVKLRPLQKK